MNQKGEMMIEAKDYSSVYKAAAAGIAACSLSGTTTQARAEVLWQSGPSELVGTITLPADTSGRKSGELPYWTIDFDQDGQDDFHFYFYGFWLIDGYRIFNDGRSYVNITADTSLPPLNPTGEIIGTPVDTRTFGDVTLTFVQPTRADTLEEVYQNALAFDPVVPSDTLVRSGSLGFYGFDQRGYWSGTFVGGDGKTYVGYLDLSVVQDTFSSPGYFGPTVGDGSATIYGSGFAQIPEPSSLALFSLTGAVLMARRRRDVN